MNLETYRNIRFEPENIIWNRYIVYHCFKKFVIIYGIIDDFGPFRLFYDDIRPSNMFADPKTMYIIALLDIEFTNVIPA